MTIERRSHYCPLKLPVAATQRRNSNRLDSPLLVVSFKIIRTVNDIVKPTDCAPMKFRGKIHYEMVIRAIDVRPAHLHVAAITTPNVIFKHVRVSTFKG